MKDQDGYEIDWSDTVGVNAYSENHVAKARARNGLTPEQEKWKERYIEYPNNLQRVIDREVAKLR